MATFANTIQTAAEKTRLGIPAVLKDNAQTAETDPRFGIGGGAGAFTQFPKEAGLGGRGAR